MFALFRISPTFTLGVNLRAAISLKKIFLDNDRH